MKAKASLFVVTLVSVLSGVSYPGTAAESGPYFASLKSDEVYMREGPSANNKVKWVYRRKGLPVEVLASFEVWRRVRTMDGEIGWIHVALLSRDRTVAVAAGNEAAVRGREDTASGIVAEAKSGAIGRLMSCGKLACQVKFDSVAGWVERAQLWGIRDGEQF
jgi:SH3-like domain-containing protein